MLSSLTLTTEYVHNVNMTARMVPDKTQMRRYLEAGLTQAQIVDQWERDSGVRVSRSAIGMAIGRYDLASSEPRPRYEDTLPWHVRLEHRNHNDARMLRLEGRRRTGRKLNEKEARLLAEWRRLLEERHAVVAYDGDTEQGFWWLRRTAQDDDIVRRNDKQGRGSSAKSG